MIMNDTGNSTETANWPVSTQVENTISFSGRKTSYKDFYGRQENNDDIFLFLN